MQTCRGRGENLTAGGTRCEGVELVDEVDWKKPNSPICCFTLCKEQPHKNTPLVFLFYKIVPQALLDFFTRANTLGVPGLSSQSKAKGLGTAPSVPTMPEMLR